MVWWNVNRDAGRSLLSEIFDPVTGFGGNGTGPDGCVTDGPFANTTMHIGPFQEITTYCLWRSFNEAASLWANSSAVKECNSKDNYYDMWKCVDNQTGGLHGSGHVGTGGTVADPDASPGDPLFYLHHGWIDRLWWAWKSQDPTNRLYQLGGYTTQSEPKSGWVNTTLDYTLYSYNILPNVTVGQVMNTEGGYLCYNYD
ncbi:hypothetical protein ZTR_00075 [Talaromyces verruculosus]|nr:hypothetical protein ZTR_00075 [Talaromyces verruculosus]